MFSRSAVALLFVILVVGQAVGQNLQKTHETCKVDSDCDPPYMVCKQGNCKRKELFPMTSGEHASVFAMIILVVLGVICSLSGGLIIIPVSILMMDFTPKQAVTLANCIVVLTSGVKYMMGLTRRNPKLPYKTIVDYNGALVVIPPLALFSTIGGIVSIMLPDVILMVLLVCVLVFCIISAIFQIRAQISRERVENEKVSLSSSISTLNEPLKEQQASDGISVEIKKQMILEGTNFHPKKFPLIVLVIISTILVGVLRGGQGFKSPFEVRSCSPGDWLILAGYFLFLLLISIIVRSIIKKEQKHKQKIGWEKNPEEVYYSDKTLGVATVWGVIAGFLATITGMGGGTLLNPLFAWLKYQPVTASWTININTLLSKIAAVTIIWLSGDILYSYVLFYGGIIAISIVIAETTLLGVIKKRKSQLIIPSGLLLILVVSCGFMTYIAINEYQEKAQSGKPVWHIKKYCD